MKRLLVAGGIVLAAGAAWTFWHTVWPISVKRDDRPSFRIDPDLPYRIELGRGSGMDGLNTIKITQDGSVTLCREKRSFLDNKLITSWETAVVTLSPEALAQILDAIERNNIRDLHRSYADVNVNDGTQWVLWITQGDKQKSVYFDNYFPREARRFAKRLDEIIAVNSSNATWQPAQDRADRELWDSIRR